MDNISNQISRILNSGPDDEYQSLEEIIYVSRTDMDRGLYGYNYIDPNKNGKELMENEFDKIWSSG